MRSTQKFLFLSSIVMIALAGCGGSNKSPANYGQQNPYLNNQFNQNQIYQTGPMCAQNQTQLTDILGQQKCYAAALPQACVAAGGVLLGQNVCRIERQLPGSMNERFIYIGQFAVNRTLNTSSLRPGETLKIIGNATPRKDENPWAIELYANGVVMGTAKSGGIISEEDSNVVLLADGAMAQQQQQQVQYQQPGQQQVGCVNPNPQGQQQVGCVNPQQYPQQQPMMMQMSYALRIYGKGNLHVQLKARAIGCEDGKGNRYPCPM